MTARKPLAKNALAAVFAAATFSSAVAQDMSAITCVQNLMDRDGPKTIVTATKKDNGAYRVDMKETSNIFGTISNRSTTLQENITCTQKLGVADDTTGEVRLESLSCEQGAFDANRQKKDFDIAFRAARSGKEAGYEVYETEITAAPRPENGIEIGMAPTRVYKNLGQPNYNFQCNITLPQRGGPR